MAPRHLALGGGSCPTPGLNNNLHKTKPTIKLKSSEILSLQKPRGKRDSPAPNLKNARRRNNLPKRVANKKRPRQKQMLKIMFSERGGSWKLLEDTKVSAAAHARATGCKAADCPERRFEPNGATRFALYKRLCICFCNNTFSLDQRDNLAR